MTKFKVGDRVAVYGPAVCRDADETYLLSGVERSARARFTGVIEDTFAEHAAIRLDTHGGILIFGNYKQCRKLKPKAERRVWIPNTSLPHDMIGPVNDDAWVSREFREGWVEFVEVRRKK